MCGIGGIITFGNHNKASLGTAIKTIISQQSHRGPDGEGYHISHPIAIGHRRLSIIDKATGQQPMDNENSDIWITFNGEIYNYQSLKEELIFKGHIFKTNSDTEVIVHGYEEWGTEVFSKLRGMFALAIIDYTKKVITLARDPFGIKPLIYRHSNDFFAFSSEINALKSIFNQRATITPSSIDLFLRYGYIPYPDTIYSNIFKLPPASFLQITFEGDFSISKYWDFNFKPDNKLTNTSHQHKLEKALDESVLTHTIADVPFGIFLSGGIDSTLVASSLKKYINIPITAFCMDFSEKKYSEYSYADQASQIIKCELESGLIENIDIDSLKKIIRQYGEPFGDSSSIPTWELAKLARKKVPLVLSGDGGDEFFAGYANNYLGILSINPWFNLKRGFKEINTRRILSSIKQIMTKETNKDVFSTYINNLTYSNSKQRKKLLHPIYHKYVDLPCKAVIEQAKECIYEPNLISKICKFDILFYLPNDILTKVDIATMAHGLEARPPIIDKEVLSVGLTIPTTLNFEYRKGVANGKILLKKILKKRGFSNKFLNRKKKGFTVPKDSWIRDNTIISNYLLNLTESQDHPISNFINLNEVGKLMMEHKKGKNNSKILWYVIILALWMETENPLTVE